MLLMSQSINYTIHIQLMQTVIVRTIASVPFDPIVFTHQHFYIRIHFDSLNFPILFDFCYYFIRKRNRIDLHCALS